MIFLPTVGFIWYIIREGEKKYAIYTQSKIYLDITGGGGGVHYTDISQYITVINGDKQRENDIG